MNDSLLLPIAKQLAMWYKSFFQSDIIKNGGSKLLSTSVYRDCETSEHDRQGNWSMR